MTAQHFAYHPLRFRLAFLASAVTCAGLSAAALAVGRAQGDVQALARAGVAAGLMAACFYVFVRLRPRAGWGVTVEPLRLVMARPFRGEPLEVPWSAVRMVARTGRRRESALALFLEEGGRLLVPAHLFPRQADFVAFCEACEQRVPPLRFDA
jgi:hypothetical protein